MKSSQPSTAGTKRHPITRRRACCLGLIFLQSSHVWGQDKSPSSSPDSAGKWPTVSAKAAGFSPASVQAALQLASQQRSSALLILHDGRIVAEEYWQVPRKVAFWSRAYQALRHGTTPAGRPIEDVASLQKSIIAVLVGMASDRELLNIDDSVATHLGPGWTQADREEERAITIRHLLSMTSGLDPDLKTVAKPGLVWNYNTAAYAQLRSVLESASGQSLAELTKAWLTDPLHMTTTSWVARKQATSQRAGNSLGLATTARDLAKFGQFVLSDGRSHGKKRLVSPKFLDQMVTSSQRMNPAYGWLWWLNGKDSYQRPGQSRHETGSLNTAAPDDTVMAQGALGRRIYVCPSRRLVVIRLGAQPITRDFDRLFWRTLLKDSPLN